MSAENSCCIHRIVCIAAYSYYIQSIILLRVCTVAYYHDMHNNITFQCAEKHTHIVYTATYSHSMKKSILSVVSPQRPEDYVFVQIENILHILFLGKLDQMETLQSQLLYEPCQCYAVCALSPELTFISLIFVIFSFKVQPFVLIYNLVLVK